MVLALQVVVDRLRMHLDRLCSVDQVVVVELRQHRTAIRHHHHVVMKVYFRLEAQELRQVDQAVAHRLVTAALAEMLAL